MPHGTPDWGLVGPKYTTYGLDDLGEHAVRLGSPHFFDRRGDALLLTDFREGLGCFYDATPAGSGRVELHTGHSRTGAYAVGLVGNPGDINVGRIQAMIAIPVLSVLGLEWTFSIAEHSRYVVGGLVWISPVDTWEAYVRYDNVNNRSEYRDNAGTFTPIPGAGRLFRDDHALHTVKMVVDMTPDPVTGAYEYVRILIDDNAYDMRGISPNLTGAAAWGHLYVEIEHQGNTDTDPVVFVDNVIVTQNEPVWQG